MENKNKILKRKIIDLSFNILNETNNDSDHFNTIENFSLKKNKI